MKNDLEDRIDAVFFMFSYKCNLKCDFCIVNSPSMSKREHSFLDLSTGIRYAERVRLSVGSPDEKFIFFYGGEPTLYWKKICAFTEELIDLSSDYGRFRYVMITNGLVPVKDWSQFPLLGRLEVRISLSDVRNLPRLLELADDLRDVGANPNFNVTVDSTEVDSWIRVIQALHARGFSYLINPLRGEAARQAFRTLIEFEDYIECVRQVYEFAMSFSEAREFRILNVRHAIQTGTNVDKDCFLNGGKQIIVLPDGSFTTCFDDLATENLQFPEDEIGGLDQLSELYYPISDPECARCTVRQYCSVGCARQNKSDDGKGWVRDHVICNVTKTITNRELALES